MSGHVGAAAEPLLPPEDRLPSEDAEPAPGEEAGSDTGTADLPGSDDGLAPWLGDSGSPADDLHIPPIAPGPQSWTPHRGTRVRARPIQRVAACLSIVAMTAVVVALLGAYWQVRSLWENIHRVPVTGLLGRQPASLSKATNILVFSSSTGTGLPTSQVAPPHLGQGTQPRADTIMVVHIPPAGGHLTVLSFPHALQVPRYGCRSPGPGKPTQTQNLSVHQPLNTSFDFGPGCLWKTVEQVTGIRLDHFIELGLAGFVKAVDDVGGVTLYSPAAVNDTATGLHLQPGYNHLDGVQAVDFWRTGDGAGVSSDLLRIHRDQNLMVSFLRSASQSDLAANPASMLGVLRDLTSSMTVDSGLAESEMLHIVVGLKDAQSHHATFLTVPNDAEAARRSQVVVDTLAQPAAGQLFSAIAHNRQPPSR